MIVLRKKEDCVGCNACSQKCPKDCISMCADEQGFNYPKVDLEKCINCHLCEHVCPVINQMDAQEPIAVFVAKNNNKEEELNSSSGGIFIAIAKQVLDEGGIVFGAKFNNEFEVIHDYTETLNGVRQFQGSKYVQSKIGESYLKAEKFLKEGRKVLFSGTPCQIAGLKLFLSKDYGLQLLTVDIVCHGVPSPLIWRNYLNTYILNSHTLNSNRNSYKLPVRNIKDISEIKFRDKQISWQKFGFSVHALSDSKSQEKHNNFFETHDENLYMQGFHVIHALRSVASLIQTLHLPIFGVYKMFIQTYLEIIIIHLYFKAP